MAKKQNSKIKEFLKLFFIGIMLGTGLILPGISGGVLAIIFGIYDKIIYTFNHIFENFKKNLEFLIPLGLGGIVSVLTISRALEVLLNLYPVATLLLFVGLIIGGVPQLSKKAKFDKNITNIIYTIIGAIIIVVLALIGNKESGASVAFANLDLIGNIKLFLVGILASATLIFPGISGTSLLMVMGYYEPLLNTVNNITRFNNIMSNIIVLVPFGIGLVIGVIVLARVIEYCLKKHETKTYSAIVGFVIASAITILLDMLKYKTNYIEIIIGIILLIIGFIISNKFEEQ